MQIVPEPQVPRQKKQYATPVGLHGPLGQHPLQG